jgi:hypothetical protein
MDKFIISLEKFKTLENEISNQSNKIGQRVNAYSRSTLENWLTFKLRFVLKDLHRAPCNQELSEFDLLNKEIV